MDKEIKIGLKVILNPKGKIESDPSGFWNAFIGKTFEVLSFEAYPFINSPTVQLQTPKNCKHKVVYVDSDVFWKIFIPMINQLEFDFGK